MKADYYYATVGAYRDIDGGMLRIQFDPDRREGDYEVVTMDVATAKRVARELNKWARAVDGLR